MWVQLCILAATLAIKLPVWDLGKQLMAQSFVTCACLGDLEETPGFSDQLKLLGTLGE